MVNRWTYEQIDRRIRIRLFRLLLVREVVELDELVNNRLFAAALDAFGHTGMQMFFEDERFEFLDRFTDRVGLAQYIMNRQISASFFNICFHIYNQIFRLRRYSMHFTS